MSDRRAWASILFLCLLPVLVAAQGERQPAAPNPPPIRPSVTLEGREIGVPVQINPGGPIFGLGPLVEALGGELVSDPSGESVTLKLAETDVVIGPGNAIITVGDLIVSLSQPPVQGEGGLQVPLDFLRKTYGDLMSFSFEWRPETQRLAIGRRGARDLSVSLDVVHIQGTTTVVLQFPEEPRYRASHEGDVILVQILADRLTPPPPKEVTDPLVASVAVEPQQIRIQLVPGAQAERYILEKPFRLVFDIQRSAEVQVPTAPAAPTDRRAGIRTIVIDPGHGGRETGAIGPSGVMEKELTLQLARELASSVGQALGVRVVLTRQDDSTLALDTRTAIANQNKADLFVSIHLNSSLGAGAHGAETYFLNPQASDSRAASAAASENLGAEEGGPGRRGLSGSSAHPLGPGADLSPGGEPAFREHDPGRAERGLAAQGPRGQAGAFPRAHGRRDAGRAGGAGLHQQSG